MTTQNRRPTTKTALLLALAACPAVALVMVAVGSGCGLSVAGALDFQEPEEAGPGKDGSVVDGEAPDGGGAVDASDALTCDAGCSADKTRVVCGGTEVAVCPGDQECIAAACAPWSPKALPGVALWLRADLGLTMSGAVVTKWADQSGQGADAIQTAAGPTVLAGFANGKPALDFAGGRGLTNATASLAGGGGKPYVVLSVGRTPLAQGSLLTLGTTVPFAASRFYLQNATTMFVHTDGANAASNVELVANIAPSLAAAFMSVHAYFGAGLAPSIRVNGLDCPVATGVQTTETGGGFIVGTTTTGATWNAPIAEIVVIAGAMTPTDRGRWETYARARYALP